MLDTATGIETNRGLVFNVGAEVPSTGALRFDAAFNLYDGGGVRHRRQPVGEPDERRRSPNSHRRPVTSDRAARTREESVLPRRPDWRRGTIERDGANSSSLKDFLELRDRVTPVGLHRLEVRPIHYTTQIDIVAEVGGSDWLASVGANLLLVRSVNNAIGIHIGC